MRVSCERCSTEYDFDATLIARGGTRVRCTHCGHVFRLMPETEVSENWTVRTLDGDFIEIATIAELKSRIISREFAEDDEIRRGNEPWKPLGDIPELAAHFAAARSHEPRQRASAPLPSPPLATAKDTGKKTLLGIGLTPADGLSDEGELSADEAITKEAPPEYHRTIQMQPGAIPPPVQKESEDPALGATLPPGKAPLTADRTIRAMNPPPPSASRGSTIAPPQEDAPRGSAPTLPSPEPSGQKGWFETPSMVPPEPPAPPREPGGVLKGSPSLHFDEDDEIFPGRRKKKRGGLGIWLALLLGLGFGLGIGFRDALPEPLREAVNDAFDSVRGLFFTEPGEREDDASGNGDASERDQNAPNDRAQQSKGPSDAEPTHPAIEEKVEEGDAPAEPIDERGDLDSEKPHRTGDAETAADKKPKANTPTSARETAALTTASLGYDALIRRADSALERGRTAAARKDYEQALELRPGSAEALTGLGFIALDTGSATQAATHFRRAAAAGYADAYIGLGDAYRKLGRDEDALAAYERYLERWPNGSQASIARSQSNALRARLGGD